MLKNNVVLLEMQTKERQLGNTTWLPVRLTVGGKQRIRRAEIGRTRLVLHRFKETLQLVHSTLTDVFV